MEPKKPQGHSRVALLPYVPYKRVAARFKVPETVGGHILKKRRVDGFTQNELGKLFGVDGYTVMNWEKGHVQTIPAARMPAILHYLGYNPEPEPSPENVGARLKWKRRSLGWSAREAARRSSVDPSTWEWWESQNDWPRYRRYRDFLIGFLEAPNDRVAASVRKVRPAGERGAKLEDA